MRALRFVLSVVALVAIAFGLVLASAWLTAPRTNTSATHFDTLIVLGNPAAAHCTPGLEMRERVDESVREYKAGVAPHIIMTGAAAHNECVEAQVMADYAATQGVPRDAVVVEGQAKDTIQNIWYSDKIMQGNGWKSAEVISSPYHLPRTGLILKHYPEIAWRTDASKWPAAYGTWKKITYVYREAYGLVRLRLNGFRPSPYLPQ